MSTSSASNGAEGRVSARAVLESERKIAGQNPYHWGHAYLVMEDGFTYSIFNPERYMWYLYEPFVEIAKLRTPGGKLVVMKCVQTGWTFMAVVSAFWFMDIMREPVLYMMPTEHQLGAFVTARFNPFITASPYIGEGFSTDSVGLKMGWGQPLYFRGAQSPKSLIEFSVGMIIHDEKDQMDPEGIAASRGRVQGMKRKWEVAISNPSIPEHGIDIEYNEGSRAQGALWCPECNEYVVPQWPESANRNHPYTPMCPSYDHELDKLNGKWIHENPKAPYKSYSMSHFLSPTVSPIEMIDEWNSIFGDPTKMQAFYNLGLGQSWAAAGTRVTDVSDLPSMGEMVPSYDRQSVMGVDVSSLLHVVVRRTWGGILWAGNLIGDSQWEELGRMMHAYNVEHCAIDVRPETTKASDFGKLFPGRVTLVEYNPNPLTKDGDEKWGEKNGVPLYTGLRTPMLDKAMARILTKTEAVPSNLPTDFWAHFRAPSRQYVKRADGKVYVSYVNTKPDHFVHAFNYAVFAGERYEGSDSERMQIFNPRGRGGKPKRARGPRRRKHRDHDDEKGEGR